MVHKLFFDRRDVGDWGLADNQGGVVILRAGVLDEEQARRDGIRPPVFNEYSVKESLEVLVTGVADVGRVEDGSDIREGLQMTAAGLVVDNSDALCAIWESYSVDSICYTADRNDHWQWCRDFFLEGEDGEGGEAQINFNELADVFDDDLAVDELETIQWGHLGGWVFNMEEFEFDSFIHSPGNSRLVF